MEYFSILIITIVLHDVKCPINHKGYVLSLTKGYHIVGLIGKGGRCVVHYDIEIYFTNHKKVHLIIKDRISESDYKSYKKRGYPIIHEEFYPNYRTYPIY